VPAIHATPEQTKMHQIIRAARERLAQFIWPTPTSEQVRPAIHVTKRIVITGEDISTEQLLEEIKSRGDLRAVIRGIVASRACGWPDEDEDDIDHAFADEMEALRTALRRGDLPEFLHVLDRALPHDLQGEALAILSRSQK
jgi:hypothetical protein